MRQLTRWMFVLVLASAALLLGPYYGPARAIEAAPQAIDQPVPPEWRPPLVPFFRKLGADDVDGIIGKTKAGQMFGTYFSGWVLRIEDKETCSSDDICLTVIGQVRDNVFQSQLMFMAGKFLSRGDISSRLFNKPTPPPTWFTRTSNRVDDSRPVTLIETPQGWILGFSFK